MALTDDQKSALEAHNNARAGKNLQRLQWDEGLARDADRWADQIAREGKLHHSSGSGQERIFTGLHPAPHAHSTLPLKPG